MRTTFTTFAPPPSPATPIYISKRSRNHLVAAAIAITLFVMWRASGILVVPFGGLAMTIVLSFPVRVLSRTMPRNLAVALSFFLVLIILFALVLGLGPVIVAQLNSLIGAAPGFVQRISSWLPRLARTLGDRGLLFVTPDQFAARVEGAAASAAQNFTRYLLGQVVGLVTRTARILVTLFGVVFIAGYLLSDARRIHAAILRSTPHLYRHDVRDLWNAFGDTLSRYIAGLTLAVVIEGGLAGTALYFLGVPYAALIGVWVAICALIPFIGAWIGAVPAVLLAFSVSTTTAILTIALYLMIQLLDSNVLTPRIQGRAVHVHPVLIFLGVVAGGELGGLLGVIFTVPLLGVLRVLFDFFRARLRVSEVFDQSYAHQTNDTAPRFQP